jgi:predicted RNase H-like nuclease (RuvC/YqgF family)
MIKFKESFQMVSISTPQEFFPSMPAPHIFDTLSYAKKLKAAGVPDVQAEAHAEAMLGVIETDLSTKYDIYEIKKEIKSLESEIKNLEKDIKNLGTEMMKLETNLRNDTKELETSLRNDMKELDTNLRNDMIKLETNLKNDMKELEEKLSYKLTIRLGAMFVTGITILAILIKMH